MSSVSNHLAKCSAVSLFQPQQITGTGNTSGTGQDVSAYEGTVLVTLDANYISGTATTLDVLLQESDTLGGTYTTLVGGGFTQVGVVDSVQSIKLEIGNTKKFIRVTGTAGGTSPVYTWAVSLVGLPKYS